MGDDELFEETVHLAAGMLFASYSSVIATMCSIGDSDAPDLQRMFTNDFSETAKVTDNRHTAEALHHVIELLRDSTSAPCTRFVARRVFTFEGKPVTESWPRGVVALAASSCPTCSVLSIMAILRDGLPRENMILLGSLVDIIHRADQCRFCHLIASLFRRCWCLDTLRNVDLSGVDCSLYATSVGALTDPDLEDRKRCHRLHIHTSRRPQEITDALTRARMGLKLDIQLLEEDVHKVLRAKELHGRRVANTVDMELVKGWIALCEREHGDACESVWWRGSEVQLPRFVRMVDVTLMSLVRAPSDCRYVALSYVWGTAADSYWTTKANVDSRAQPAGLDPFVLPATIVDSIHVTQALGERYLWIDALCIIQDSSDDKGDQIRAMELIYSRALLTIIAAGGESVHARLPGVSAGSRPLHQHIEVIQDLHLTIPLPSLREAITESIWDTRGWTFQELLLSRRRLFFTKHQLYFECAKDVWCEDLVAESKTVRHSDHPMRYLGSGAGLFLRKPPILPDPDYMTSYANTIGRYTQRRLTYPSDIIHAITALTNAMTRGYQLAGGNAAQAFRYGMQIRNLDHSLLWQPRLDSAHARRGSPDMGVSAWPSWAWAGWTGAVSYSDLIQLMDTVITPGVHPKPVESLVASWHVVDDHQQLIHLDVELIPFSQIGNSKDVASSRYLAPEGDIEEQLLKPLPPAGTLIFRTQYACFRVSKLEATSSDSKSLPHTIFHILSDVRKPSVGIGRMILPSSTPSSTVLEFIVLSRCGGMTGLHEDGIYGDWYHGCMLHVMAVRRRVGDDVRVRERVGLGVVFEKAWLECSAEVGTIFLS